MSEYPKEVLDAFAKTGITFNRKERPDTRLAYGATCTWFGPIKEVHETKEGLPCCPFCAGILFELDTEAEWWQGIDKYENEGHPGYRAMWEWQRRQQVCFSARNGIAELEAAFREAYSK